MAPFFKKRYFVGVWFQIFDALLYANRAQGFFYVPMCYVVSLIALINAKLLFWR